MGWACWGDMERIRGKWRWTSYFTIYIHEGLFYLFYFYWIFIYILNIIPFPGFLSSNPLSHLPTPCLHEGAHQLTHPLPPPCPGILLHWCIEPSQDQGPLLPLMPNKAILCYICSWSHGSVHVYSLVGGLVPGSSGGGGGGDLVSWYCSSYGVAKLFSSFIPKECFLKKEKCFPKP